MFVRDNFVHGDLHGGNIMHAPPAHPPASKSLAAWPARAAAWFTGREEGAGGVAGGVVVIDAGLVTRVSGAHAGLFRRFLAALCQVAPGRHDRGLRPAMRSESRAWLWRERVDAVYASTAVYAVYVSMFP
jgi:predicted unusual protein kinase regulating ubiquinone biosynthesis (AarF/ABC1/UbiB family)